MREMGEGCETNKMKRFRIKIVGAVIALAVVAAISIADGRTEWTWVSGILALAFIVDEFARVPL